MGSDLDLDMRAPATDIPARRGRGAALLGRSAATNDPTVVAALHAGVPAGMRAGPPAAAVDRCQFAGRRAPAGSA
jgi:hypothetical protein